jgi:hypothetical protein
MEISGVNCERCGKRVSFLLGRHCEDCYKVAKVGKCKKCNKEWNFFPERHDFDPLEDRFDFICDNCKCVKCQGPVTPDFFECFTCKSHTCTECTDGTKNPKRFLCVRCLCRKCGRPAKAGCETGSCKVHCDKIDCKVHCSSGGTKEEKEEEKEEEEEEDEDWKKGKKGKIPIKIIWRELEKRRSGEEGSGGGGSEGRGGLEGRRLKRGNRGNGSNGSNDISSSSSDIGGLTFRILTIKERIRLIQNDPKTKQKEELFRQKAATGTFSECMHYLMEWQIQLNEQENEISRLTIEKQELKNKQENEFKKLRRVNETENV